MKRWRKKITIVWIDKVSELSYHRKLFYQRLSSYEKRKLFVTRCHILRASERVIVTEGERMHETRDAFCEHCEPSTISVSAYSIQVVPVNLPLPPLSLPSPPQKRKIREGKLCVWSFFKKWDYFGDEKTGKIGIPQRGKINVILKKDIAAFEIILKIMWDSSDIRGM